MCLSFVISILMIASAFAEAYRHEPTGIVFPERLATLEKESEVTDFETERPGLGVSIGYNGPGVTVTIYIYTMGLKKIPSDLNSPIMKASFTQAANEIEMAGEQGIYRDVTKLSEGEATWGPEESGVNMLHASYSYNRDDEDRLSHLYLTGYQNHFLKVRFTYDKEIQETAEQTRNDFIEEFSRVLVAETKKTN
jgi:hypothetical protein